MIGLRKLVVMDETKSDTPSPVGRYVRATLICGCDENNIVLRLSRNEMASPPYYKEDDTCR